MFFFGNNNPNLRPSSAIIWEIASKIFLRPKCVTRFPLLSYITWLNYGKSVPTARSNIASKFTVSLLTELFSLDFPLDPNVDPHCTGFSSLLYVLNLLTLSGTTTQKIPNMGKIQAKSDQTLTSVAGHKWAQKSDIFGKVLEKGLTWSEAFLEFRIRPQVFSK